MQQPLPATQTMSFALLAATVSRPIFSVDGYISTVIPITDAIPYAISHELEAIEMELAAAAEKKKMEYDV